MKKLLNFEVSGENEQEVEEKALVLYREYMNDEGAEFPHNTMIQAKLQYDAGVMVGWVAEVSVSLNISPY